MRDPRDQGCCYVHYVTLRYVTLRYVTCQPRRVTVPLRCPLALFPYRPYAPCSLARAQRTIFEDWLVLAPEKQKDVLVSGVDGAISAHFEQKFTRILMSSVVTINGRSLRVRYITYTRCGRAHFLFWLAGITARNVT